MIIQQVDYICPNATNINRQPPTKIPKTFPISSALESDSFEYTFMTTLDLFMDFYSFKSYLFIRENEEELFGTVKDSG